jgi:hypothetical protein
MPGLHGQLTSTELADAIDATEVLYNLGPYLERMTYIKIGTLRADLQAEREDRDKTRAQAGADATNPISAA